MEFKIDEYGFWRQIDPKPFKYDDEYKAVQKTTPEMSWLRLGYLFSAIQPDVCRSFKCVDVGSGNGCFAKEASRFFTNGVMEYDLSGNTISDDELYGTEWDLIFLTDVLEHYHDIEDLFKIPFRNVFLSFPETPCVSDLNQLSGWRHFRPDEHIWYLNASCVKKWLADHGCMILSCGSPEDAIRKPPEGFGVNISTVIARRINPY